MRRRRGKINRWVIFILALVAILFYFLETRTVRTVPSRLYSMKLDAARLSARALELVRNYRLNELHLPIDSINDPNLTGLVGVQFSQITYGRSDLSDALTSTNPNFSAALVEMFYKTGVKKGDTVAINWDGTYPALNIQILTVVKTLGLTPLIVSDQSSGMWGANYPGWTWLEIERVFREGGVWDFKSVLATRGGETDDGRGFSPEGRAILDSVARTTGVELFVPASLSEGVAKRAELFRRCRLLVAVGKASSNSGDPDVHLPSGVFTERYHRKVGNGIVAVFLSNRLPVIHIASPRRIASIYRLPIAPVPMGEIGKGRLFFERRYSVPRAIFFALALIGLLFFVVRYEVEYYLGVRSEEEGEAV
ncbi:MAG: poly-gamma-glutamate system protein [bacterium]